MARTNDNARPRLFSAHVRWLRQIYFTIRQNTLQCIPDITFVWFYILSVQSLALLYRGVCNISLYIETNVQNLDAFKV